MKTRCNDRKFQSGIAIGFVALFLIGQAAAAGSGKKDDGPPKKSLQDHLLRYLDDVTKAHKKYRTKEQEKVKKELLLSAKKRFSAARKTSKPKVMTIARHFENLLDNIDLAKEKFRGVQDEKAMIAWDQEAARIFMQQVKVAEDIAKQPSGQRWFEKFVDMATQLRTRCRFSDQLARSIWATIGQTYSMVLKKTKINKNPYGSPADRYAKNLRFVRSKFPIKTPDQKKQNSSMLRALERNAQLLFRLENESE